MPIRSYRELGTLFANQSTGIWERLGYVRESYTSRGVLGPVRFGEETITDLLMMDLYVQGSRLAHFQQTSKPDEAMWGTDFELWLGSERKGWFRFAIQAKKLDLRTDRYASLTQGNLNGQQIDLLEKYAQLNSAAPLYCLYNHSDSADEFEDWHCCTGPTDLKELGCTVTPSSNIRTAIDEWAGKNFKSIHKNNSTLPWKCLVSCPMVWYSLEVMSGGISDGPILGVPPLFNPESCYHETAPMVLRRDSGAVVVRENDLGGSLISIRVDGGREIDRSVGRFESTARGDFRERYHPDSGLPKAAAVIEVQGPEQGSGLGHVHLGGRRPPGHCHRAPY